MKKKPPRDPIASFERETRAARKVGPDKCKCGEGRPLALIPGSNPPICADCQREKDGKSPFDKHHPAGRANNPFTIPINVNDHRADLSPKQYEWSNETWKNPQRSPLRAGAGNVRGYCDTDEHCVVSLLIPLAEMLEVLDAFLLKQLGPKWWKGTEMERFAPKQRTRRNRGFVAR
jgi:hypothetical protein